MTETAQQPPPAQPLVAKIALVGCGGIGGWILECLSRLMQEGSEIRLIDGDTVETRNLDRQLFRPRDTGKHKCDAIITYKQSLVKAKLVAVPQYIDFCNSKELLGNAEMVLCAVDNHRARCAVLSATDETAVPAIVAANQYSDAEAYFYQQGWKDTYIDPRIYYPDMLNTDVGSPLRPESCTGEAQEAIPQLALANMKAASHAMWLFWFWYTVASSLREESLDTAPVHIKSLAGRMRVKRVCDYDS